MEYGVRCTGIILRNLLDKQIISEIFYTQQLPTSQHVSSEIGFHSQTLIFFGWRNLIERGRRPPTIVGVRKLYRLPFDVITKYWQ